MSRAIVVWALVGVSWPAWASTFTVTTTADDDSAGTLRTALNGAAATSDQDTILFDIPGTGPHVIALTAALPPSGPGGVIIDGFSQDGALVATDLAPAVLPIVIYADGAAEEPPYPEVPGTPALYLTGDSVLRGVMIIEAHGPGVFFTGGSLLVEGTAIGTNPEGLGALPNQGCGILAGAEGAAPGEGLPAGDVVIGGPTSDLRNIISGGEGFGICGRKGTSLTIRNTLLGVADDRITSLPNEGGALSVQMFHDVTLEAGTQTTGSALLSLTGAFDVSDALLGVRPDGTLLGEGGWGGEVGSISILDSRFGGELDMGASGTALVLDTDFVASGGGEVTLAASGAAEVRRGTLLGIEQITVQGLDVVVEDLAFEAVGDEGLEAAVFDAVDDVSVTSVGLGAVQDVEVDAGGDAVLDGVTATVSGDIEITAGGRATVLGSDLTGVVEDDALRLMTLSGFFGADLRDSALAGLTVLFQSTLALDLAFTDNTLDDVAVGASPVQGVFTFQGNTGLVRSVSISTSAEVVNNALEVETVSLYGLTVHHRVAGNTWSGGPTAMFDSGEGSVVVEQSSFEGFDVSAVGSVSVGVSDVTVRALTIFGYMGATAADVVVSNLTSSGPLSVDGFRVAIDGATCDDDCELDLDGDVALDVAGLAFLDGEGAATLSSEAGPITVRDSHLAGFGFVDVVANGNVELSDTEIREGFDGLHIESTVDITLDGCMVDEFEFGAVTLMAGDDLAIRDTTVGRLGGSAGGILEGVFALLGSAGGDVTVTGSTFSGVRGGIGLRADGAATFSDTEVDDLHGGSTEPVLIVHAASDVLAERDAIAGVEGIDLSSDGGHVTLRDGDVDSPGAILFLRAPSGRLEVTGNTLAAGNTTGDPQNEPALTGGDVSFNGNTWTVGGEIGVRGTSTFEFSDNIVRASAPQALLFMGCSEGNGTVARNDVDGLRGFFVGAQQEFVIADNRVVLAGVDRTLGFGGQFVDAQRNHLANADGSSGMGGMEAYFADNTFEDLTAFDGISALDLELVGNTFTGIGAGLPSNEDDLREVQFEGAQSLRFEGNTFAGALHPVRLQGGSVEMNGNTLDDGRGFGVFGQFDVELGGNVVTGQHPYPGEDEAAAALVVGPWAGPESEGSEGPIDCTITGNRFEDNPAGAIFAMCEATADVRDNDVLGNTGTGLFLVSPDAVLAGNDASDNAGPGAVVYGGGAIEATGNRLVGNGGHGLLLLSEGIAQVRGNALHDNGGPGIRSAGPVLLEDNQYGHNGGLAVDVGLSGEFDLFFGTSVVSPNEDGVLPPCRTADVESGLVSTAWPTVDEATLDGQGRLVLRGTGCPGSTIDIYRAEADPDEPTFEGRPHGEGTSVLGTVTAASVTGQFTLVVEDVAFLAEGPAFVTAMATTEEWGSSEFGPNQPLPSCGNGTLDPAEACDDGNNDTGDGCSAVCAAEHGWHCTAGPSHGCTATCGDGVVAVGQEECDDDNALDGDGCSVACALEIGFACAGDPLAIPESTCAAVCGDFRVLGLETCDDGNAVGGDGCSATCLDQPVTRVLTGPADPTSAQAAVFTYADANAVAVRFECSEDSGASWVACDEATGDGAFRYAWTGALAAENTFLVKGFALDGTADEAPARWDWSIESDADDDGHDASTDNCPDDANADQADADEDGQGDVCDDDIDGDGLINAVEDINGDGVVDGRETDPLDADTDGDGLCDGPSDLALPCDGGEDANLDGATSSDETDPTLADTDGDCANDGDEVDAGTDPLEADVEGACEDDTGCGCSTAAAPGLAAWLVPLVLLLRRRRALGALLVAFPAHAATFTVNDAGNDADATIDEICATAVGDCTLRAALQAATDSPGPDTIAFAIPGPGTHTILPFDALPVADDVLIDGFTQPGAVPETATTAAVIPIVLNGTMAEGLPFEPDVAGVPGLYLTGDSAVRGVTVVGFTGPGLYVAGDSVEIEGVAIGTVPTGSFASPNQGCGIQIGPVGGGLVGTVRIGGTAPADKVIVAGNNGPGICAYGGGDIEIVGTRIGVRRDGTSTLPNGSTGIDIELHPDSNEDWTIGRVLVGEGTQVYAPGSGTLIQATGLVDMLEIEGALVGARPDGLALGDGNAVIYIAIKGVRIANSAIASSDQTYGTTGTVEASQSDFTGTLLAFQGPSVQLDDVVLDAINVAALGNDVVLTHSTIDRPGAVLQLEAGTVTLEDNTVRGVAALEVTAVTEAVVRNNDLAVAEGAVFRADLGTVLCEGNTIEAGGEGVQVVAPFAVDVLGNTLTGSALIVRGAAITTGTVSGNTFDLSGGFGAENVGRLLLTANTGYLEAIEAGVGELVLTSNVLEGDAFFIGVAGKATLADNDLTLGEGISVDAGTIQANDEAHTCPFSEFEGAAGVTVTGGRFGILVAEEGPVTITGVSVTGIEVEEVTTATVSDVTCGPNCGADIEAVGDTMITGSSFVGPFAELGGRDLLVEDVSFAGGEQAMSAARDLTVRDSTWTGGEGAELEAGRHLVAERLSGVGLGDGFTGGAGGDASFSDIVLADLQPGAEGLELFDVGGDLEVTRVELDGAVEEVELGAAGDVTVRDVHVDGSGATDFEGFLVESGGDALVEGVSVTLRGAVVIAAEDSVVLDDVVVRGGPAFQVETEGTFEGSALDLVLSDEFEDVSGVEASEGITLSDATIDADTDFVLASGGATHVSDSTLTTRALLAIGEESATIADTTFDVTAFGVLGRLVHLTDNEVDFRLDPGAEDFEIPVGALVIESIDTTLERNVFRGAYGAGELEGGGALVLLDNRFEDVTISTEGIDFESIQAERNTFIRLDATGAPGEEPPPIELLATGFAADGDLLVRDNTFVDPRVPIGFVGDGLEFSDNTVTGGQGLILGGTTSLAIERNEIRENRAEHFLGTLFPVALFAAQQSGSEGSSIVRCVVRDNAITDNESGGIALACIDGAVIANNAVTGNEFWGIFAAGHTLELSDNVVSDNLGSGAFVGANDGALAIGNDVSRNGGVGMAVGDGSLSIIPSPSPVPVRIAGSAPAYSSGVYDNVVKNNGATGLLVMSAVDIHDNLFGGNQGSAINLSFFEALLSFSGIAGVTPNAPDQHPACDSTLADLSGGSLLATAWPTVARSEIDAQGRLVLHGTACPGARVEIYRAEPDPDEPSRGGIPHGEGVEVIGELVAGPSGAFQFVVDDIAFTRTGPAWVTALAWRPDAGTSEFGPNLPVPSCGDGTLDVLDACDDGNNDAADGCSPTCGVEHGWDCGPTGCATTCGDGLLAAGAEACDDDNTTDGDGCTAACTLEDGFSCTEGSCVAICGDHEVLGLETCDDGNTADNDGCTAACLREPQTIVLSGPASGALEGSFTYTDHSGVAVAFECAQDDGAFAACNDRAPEPGVYRYTWTGTVASGETHVFHVRGVAADGILDPTPAGFVWFVDEDPDDDGLTAGDNCPDAANPGQEDHDSDALGDACDDDVDGDGLLDEVEDVDADGEVDGRETDPFDADTDGDGLCDGFSDDYLFDPGDLSPCIAGEDLDFDGVTDDDETDPTLADTDGDCVEDGEEIYETETDPRDADDPGTTATCSTGETGGGCNCNTAAPGPAWLLALAALLPLRRRLSAVRSAP